MCGHSKTNRYFVTFVENYTAMKWKSIICGLFAVFTIACRSDDTTNETIALPQKPVCEYVPMISVSRYNGDVRLLSYDINPNEKPGVSFHWTGPNGFDVTIDTYEFIFPFTGPEVYGSYTLVMSGEDCASAPVSVSFLAPPCLEKPIPFYNYGLIPGETLQLQTPTVEGVSYHWTGPNGFTSNQQNPTIPNAGNSLSGTYSVYTTLGDCTSQAGTLSVAVDTSIVMPCTLQNNTGFYGDGRQFSVTSTNFPNHLYVYCNGGPWFWIEFRSPIPIPAGTYDLGTINSLASVHISGEGGGISVWAVGGSLQISYTPEGKMRLVLCDVPCKKFFARLPIEPQPYPSISARVTVN